MSPKTIRQPLTAASVVWPGRPDPLGATWDGRGVNFALFSEHATRAQLCLFDEEGKRELRRVNLPEQTNNVWHGYLPGAQPGQLYGYRVYGTYNPLRGLRFNPQKLLLDPYARDIGRAARWDDALYGYEVGSRHVDLSLDDRDSAPFAPLGRVIDPAFDWGNDRRPQTPWPKTVLYELHVKGFTKLHPGVPEPLRGTYAGLATPAAIGHLRRLGVTAVELLPVHAHLDERFLFDAGRSNYWGYNTLGFFAPERRYASRNGQDAVNEFKTMVRSLHEAGIEVILDVVYNHTAEGNELGPTVSWRGIDNAAYYRLEEDRRRYTDFTGCGNTLNMRHPRTLQLIMDSLRYWAGDMHVDGFRFDLASALARELYDVDRLAAFFDIIGQDPLLSRVKLIAEPWDLGPGGYQVGNFPPGWAEWNGRYRDVMRRFWKGDGGLIGEVATRHCGSSDLYAWSGRQPYASINFNTCHDGFTLRDLVSYDRKHNEANGEGNRDGTDDNQSWNSGVEGPTVDPEIESLRQRRMRSLLATLALSQGVPMLLAGDEFGQTQRGNNNAYCQDNELAWLDWRLRPDQEDLIDFVARLIALRLEQPVFRRRRFLQGRPIHGKVIKDIYWGKPSGGEVADAEWGNWETRCIAIGLAGNQIAETDEMGQCVVGDSFLVLLNAGHEPVNFKLGPQAEVLVWEQLIDTSRAKAEVEPIGRVSIYSVPARSLLVWRVVSGESEFAAKAG